MKTAIITGASSGLGREFARQLADVFPDIECCWLIARREDRLEEIAREMVGVETVCLPLDLCDSMSFTTLQEKLAAEKPEVAMLINNAGCGYLGLMGEVPTDTQTRMVDLNVRAVTAVTHMTVPYLVPGARVLNVSSIAAFCPCPRMTVYSATKAFVRSFCNGLRRELDGKGIRVLEVSPGWVSTDFIPGSGGDVVPPGVFRHTVTREEVVAQAMRDLQKGRKRSLCGWYDRVQVWMCTHFPSLATIIWERSLGS